MLDYYARGRQTEPAKAPPSEVPEPRTQPESRHTAPEQPQCHSPAISPSNPRPNLEPESIPRRASIENLAQKLSRQDLQLDGSFLVPPRPSPSSPSLLPDRPPRQPCATLEIGRDPRLDESSLLDRHELDSLTLPLASLPSMMDTDDGPVPDAKKLRRQQSSRFNTDPTNSRVAQSLVESMISSGSQCNVRSGPLPTMTSRTKHQPITETDSSFDLSSVGLEVDEAYCEGNSPADDELAWIENAISLRRAGSPGGIRKNGLIRYWPSAEAGLRSANVVRNRPRMRRRPKIGPSSRSRASSAVSSAISSPVIPPSLPDDHFH